MAVHPPAPPDWVDVAPPVQTGWDLGGEAICHGWLTKERQTGKNVWWERYVVLRRGGLLGWFPQPPADEVRARLPLRWVYVAGATVSLRQMTPAPSNRGPLYALEVQEASEGEDVTPPILFGCDSMEVVNRWFRELVSASLKVKEPLVYIPWNKRVSSYSVEVAAVSSRRATRTAESLVWAGNATGIAVELTFRKIGAWLSAKVSSYFEFSDQTAAIEATASASRMLGTAAGLSVQMPGMLLGAVGRYGGGASRPSFSSVCSGQIRRSLDVRDTDEEFNSQLFVCDGCSAMPIPDEGCLCCHSRLCLACFVVHTTPPEVHPPLEVRMAGRTSEEERTIDLVTHAQSDADQERYNVRLLEARASLRDAVATVGSIQLPSTWTTRYNLPEKNWAVLPIKDIAALRGLQACLETQGEHLGFGRDVGRREPYNRLQLAAAWRIEHHVLWPKYCSSLAEVNASRSSLNIPQLSMLNEAGSLSDDLCDWSVATGCPLNADVNEKLLAHGTRPEHVIAVLQTGMNERFFGGFFGSGCYLAEDCGKCDQYTTVDTELGAHPDLHELLYEQHHNPHPGDVYYIFLARAALGVVAHTRDGEKEIDTGTSLWANPDKRELAAIPGSTLPYHALLVEKGAAVRRYREIVVFHGDRIYPEFLLAYRRM